MKSSDARNTIHDGPFRRPSIQVTNITDKILTRLSPKLLRVLKDRLANISASQKLEKKGRERDVASQRERSNINVSYG